VEATPPSRRLDGLRRLARLADAWFRVPGTEWRIGFDPLVGLVPGIGDAIGAVVSAAVIVQAARWGASGPVLFRMLVNVAVDAVGGSIPVVGDVFDAAWKANIKNVDLLERYLADPAGVHRVSATLLAALVVAIIVVVLGALALTVLVLRAALHILAR
jgi:hypothetical protein